jgi:hypothetical protein
VIAPDFYDCSVGFYERWHVSAAFWVFIWGTIVYIAVLFLSDNFSLAAVLFSPRKFVCIVVWIRGLRTLGFRFRYIVSCMHLVTYSYRRFDFHMVTPSLRRFD